MLVLLQDFLSEWEEDSHTIHWALRPNYLLLVNLDSATVSVK